MANYARGNVGPHVLLEMDEAASNVAGGVVALSDVAAEAGVNKLTGQLRWVGVVKPQRPKGAKPRLTLRLGVVQAAAAWSWGRS